MAKVTLRTDPEVYVPKTIEIVFEKEEEYEAFVAMARTNVSVPSAVYRISTDKQRVLADVLDAINLVT